MANDAQPELVHKVNNLLAVIHAQAAAARRAGTLEAATRALELIEKSARGTEDVVRKSGVGRCGDA